MGHRGRATGAAARNRGAIGGCTWPFRHIWSPGAGLHPAPVAGLCGTYGYVAARKGPMGCWLMRVIYYTFYHEKPVQVLWHS